VEQRSAFLAKADEIISSGNFKHIVQLGIGGSYIGPKMVNEALSKYSNGKFTIDYISNIDSADFHKTFTKIDTDKTLFLVASKSLTTAETQFNLERVLTKLGLAKPNKQFICLTANKERALEIGFASENILTFDIAVGGRYSLWSSIGFSVALNVGTENFVEFLKGAAIADKHFSETDDYFSNIPFLLAFINVWYRNFFDLRLKAYIPYSDALKFLPEYLQQLEMESLGKIVDLEGKKVRYATGGSVFGNLGTNCQHSFFQMIHQGVDIIPVEFVAIADSERKLLANCFAQSRAMMLGKDLDETETNKQKYFPGNIPSNTVLFDKLTPSSLGTFLAIQEHKVFVQSVILGINPFDQFGVELGKSFEKEIELEIEEKRVYDFDSSTNGLLARIEA
jgi:glucose-6-phosphate isomerase